MLKSYEYLWVSNKYTRKVILHFQNFLILVFFCCLSCLVLGIDRGTRKHFVLVNFVFMYLMRYLTVGSIPQAVGWFFSTHKEAMRYIERVLLIDLRHDLFSVYIHCFLQNFVVNFISLSLVYFIFHLYSNFFR